jgi:hypothetical protein
MHPLITVGVDGDGAVVIRIERMAREQRLAAVQRELEELGLFHEEPPSGAEQEEAGVCGTAPVKRIGF